MLFLYQLTISIILALSPIIITYRIIKKKEDKKRFIEKFCFFSQQRRKGKLVWFHGASVGELLSIIPLIKNYEKDNSISQILVTSSTLSSSKILKNFKLKKTFHQFYPIDSFLLTNKFLNYWRPNIAIFVESEIWPFMFKNIKDKKIPLILLNARLSKRSFYNWMRIKSFSDKIFSKITIAFPQNNETKNYLKRLNTKKIIQIGNLKFAENYNEKLRKFNKKFKKELNKKKVWVASSTHKDEELFCAKAHIELKKKIKDLLTIIIPRHIHRTQDIISKIKNLNLNVSTHSSNPKSLKNVDIYVVDTFGETQKFHKIGSSVFLGGSIINRGGQNPLEAARYGAKILHGPNIDNFKDVYKLLKLLKISKKIKSSKELSASVVFKKNSNRGLKIKNIGDKILKKTIKEINNIIINEFKKT